MAYKISVIERSIARKHEALKKGIFVIVVVALMSYFPAVLPYLRIFYVLITLVFLLSYTPPDSDPKQSERHYGALVYLGILCSSGPYGGLGPVSRACADCCRHRFDFYRGVGAFLCTGAHLQRRRDGSPLCLCPQGRRSDFRLSVGKICSLEAIR
jgi:hypothetical protein